MNDKRVKYVLSAVCPYCNNTIKIQRIVAYKCHNEKEPTEALWKALGYHILNNHQEIKKEYISFTSVSSNDNIRGLT